MSQDRILHPHEAELAFYALIISPQYKFGSKLEDLARSCL